jgi:3-methyladenine DNA glycosylase AlkD
MAQAASARSAVVKAIAAEIREFCISHANPDVVRKYAKYFTEGYDAFGLSYKDPEWAAHRGDWGERLRAAGGTAWLDAGDVLTRTGKYEEASFAIEFAADLADLHTAASFRRLGQWFDGGIRTWGHTDALCSLVLSHFLLDGIVGLDALEPWCASGHKYQRRAAAVMLIPLLKRRTDYETLFGRVEPLMADPERVVHQGVGWFLREAWKRQPGATDKFLLRYKDTAPRLIFQYATEKMTPEQKARFKRSK